MSHILTDKMIEIKKYDVGSAIRLDDSLYEYIFIFSYAIIASPEVAISCNHSKLIPVESWYQAGNF